MNWKRKLIVFIEGAFEFIPESKHEEFVNDLIKLVFEYFGGIKE